MVKREAQKEITTEEVKSSPDVKLRYKVETPNGIYVIKRPLGRYGVMHFTLISKALPSSTDENGKIQVSPADQERFTAAFEEWSAKVLPNIFIEGPGDIKSAEDMPGEDQYSLFIAMFNTVNFGADLFRFVE